MGPGRHDKDKPFGAELNKVIIGLPGKNKVKEGPGPGEYDESTADKLVKPKTYEAFIDNQKIRADGTQLDGTKVKADYEAEAGITGKNFGEGLNKVDMGRPYEFKAKEGPGPG